MRAGRGSAEEGGENVDASAIRAFHREHRLHSGSSSDLVLAGAASTVHARVLSRVLAELRCLPHSTSLPSSPALTTQQDLLAGLVASRVDHSTSPASGEPSSSLSHLPILQRLCLSAVSPATTVPLACAALSARYPDLLWSCARSLASNPSDVASATSRKHLLRMQLAEVILLSKAVMHLDADNSSSSSPSSSPTFNPDHCLAAFQLCKAWQAADNDGSVANNQSSNQQPSFARDPYTSDCAALEENAQARSSNSAQRKQNEDEHRHDHQLRNAREQPRWRFMPFLLRLCRVWKMPFDRFCDEVAEDPAVTSNVEANREIARITIRPHL